MKKPRFIKLVSDTTFKYFWKNKETKKWYVEIIKEKTGIDLTNYYVTNNEINTGNTLKDSRTDITLTDGKNKVVIVEMQNEYSSSAMIKALYYLFRSTGTLFEEGDDFNEDSTTTLIMFNNFYNKIDKKAPLVTYTFNSNEINHTYEFVKSYEIYLPVYYKLSYNNLNKIDKRLYLFRCKSYEEMKSIIDNEEDLKIVKRLEMLGMNRKFVSEYDREKVNKKLMNSLRNEGLKLGEERGRILGLNEGKLEGKLEEKMETAKNMLRDKLSFETISKYTGLSIKQIKNICL